MFRLWSSAAFTASSSVSGMTPVDPGVGSMAGRLGGLEPGVGGCAACAACANEDSTARCSITWNRWVPCVCAAAELAVTQMAESVAAQLNTSLERFTLIFILGKGLWI